MSRAKPQYTLYLGGNENENERALDLASELEPEYKVVAVNVKGVPFFEEHWHENMLPALVGGQRPGTTNGAGQHFGLENIRGMISSQGMGIRQNGLG